MWKPVASTYDNLVQTLLSTEHNLRAVEANRGGVQPFISEFYDLVDEKKDDADYSPLEVLRLEKLWRAIELALGSSAENIIHEVLERLAPIFPNEVPQILDHLHLFCLQESTNVKNILLKGAVQSGKTTMILLLSLCYMLTGMDVVVMLRNKNCDKDQFNNRYNQLFTSAAFDDLEFTGRCFPEIYRKDNLEKLLEEKLRGPFALIIDEADMRENSPRDAAFVALYEAAAQSIFVSATVQDICFENFNISRRNVIKFMPPKGYRGLDVLQIETPTNHNCLDEILKDREYAAARPEHPRIVLITRDYLNHEIEKEAAAIAARDISSRTWVIEYTGNNGIVLFARGRELPKQIAQHGRFSKGDKFTFRKKTMSQVLLLLARYGGKRDFETLIIVAGRMADRGINFASFDPRNKANCWHITHQILEKPATSTCASLIQSLRILGVHNDEVPLKLYVNEETAARIMAAAGLCDQLVDAAISLDFKEDLLEEVAVQVPVCEASLPKRFLARKRPEVLNLVDRGGVGEDLVAEEEEDEAEWLIRTRDTIPIYNSLLAELKNYDGWKPRARLNVVAGARTWDLRKLCKKSKVRGDSQIQVRKVGGRVQYKYVQ